MVGRAAAEFSEHVESEPEEEAAEGFAEPGAHFCRGAWMRGIGG